MSVAAYDQRQAFRQDAIARLGEKAGGGGGAMSSQQRAAFNESPFMQQMKVIENAALEKLNARDKKRQETDPNFKPQDSDFNAPKAHNYSKTIDYYGVLGLDEYATLDAIKKAYRKLSLAYHPDKTTDKSQEEKDEAAAVFIEVKNAYKTLSDNPTRRQYDSERDRDAAGAEVHGHKVKKAEATINAKELLTKLQERAALNKKATTETVRVDVSCKLEKFVFGGHKAIERPRRVKDKMEYSGFREDFRLYRIDLPAGAANPHISFFRRAGNQYTDAEADSLEFSVTPKPHDLVEMRGNDLIAKTHLSLGNSLSAQPYLRGEATVLRGRHVLFWGQNPFYGSTSRRGLMRMNIHGEGMTRESALTLNASLDLETGTASSSTAAKPQPPDEARRHTIDCRKFLESFDLGPQWGFQAVEETDKMERRCSESSTMLKRAERRKDQELCEIELARVGEPVALYTKPPCIVTFYMNKSQSPFAANCEVEPKPILVISMNAPACAAKKAEADWTRLRTQVAPLLQKYGFFMVRLAVRRILLRSLPPRSTLLVLSAKPSLELEKTSESVGPKKSGDEAFARGDFWHALHCYNACLVELREGDSARAKVLSNRAGCFAKLDDFAASLADAQEAVALEPQWGKAWSRVGFATWRLHGSSNREAVDAYSRAVEFEPSDANVRSLQSLAADMQGPNVEDAHKAKERGNDAMQEMNYGAAVAAYTVGIAMLPLASQKPAESDDLFGTSAPSMESDPHALLRAILYSNRAAAFIYLHRFDAAIADGRSAVASNAAFVKARCQLATALLGRGFSEEAYCQFARAVQLDPENTRAGKGRKACLTDFLLMRSLPPRLRIYHRYYLDWKRPKGSTRIFAISDVHFDRTEMEDWVHGIDSYLFQDDVLIVAGNLATTAAAVGRGLSVLKSKFRRVFYTIGNYETWLAISEWGKYPDSIAKMNSIFEICDELGVDIYPAPICEGLFVVPIISWYNAEFDSKDPVPSGRLPSDDRAKWPMDPDVQLWKYMLRLNEMNLSKRFFGTVITFSHFLPRQELPIDTEVAGMMKTCGCTEIDEMVRGIKTKLHVFGHSGQKCQQVIDGVKYVQCPVAHAKAREPEIEPRLMMVHNGKDVCMQEWCADGEPPLGFIKRIQHIACYILPGLQIAKYRELVRAVEKMNAMQGIQASFTAVGSAQKKMPDIHKEVWPELKNLDPWGSTHVLHIVADTMQALKACMTSSFYRSDFDKAVSGVSKGRIIVQAPLGIDLIHEGKGRDDPILVVFVLRLPILRISEMLEQMEKAIGSINAPSFSQGKLAVGLQRVGIPGKNPQEVMKELESPELNDTGGMTHVLSFYVNNPDTFKPVAGSKTFGRLRSAYAGVLRPLVLPGGISVPAELAYVFPLEFSSPAAAPKPPKKTGPRRSK